MEEKEGGRRTWINGDEAWRLLRKDGAAKADTLLTPRPPQRTGKEAWYQASSLNCVFKTAERTSLTVVSRSTSAVEATAGLQRSKYWSRGIPKQVFKRKKASCEPSLPRRGEISRSWATFAFRASSTPSELTGAPRRDARPRSATVNFNPELCQAGSCE